MLNAKEMLSSLSLKEKVGQLFHIGIPKAELNEATIWQINEIKPGGIIYFSRNIQNPGQLKNLSLKLQQLSSIPLFISTDQEGGAVMRLVDGVTVFPGNMALGATRSATLSYQAGRITGEELYLLGINMNLAPVLDVNNNPNNPVIGLRSFGEDPNLVSELGSALVLGLQDAMVIATGKHFPGHGDTNQDSHLNLPVVAHPLARLHEVELMPFKSAIQKGLRAIMTAHVVFPAIEPDPTTPATLSKKVLTGLLREELGFDGLILTDCMEMKAISDTYGTKEGAIRTIIAGADMILISHTPKLQLEAYYGLLNAVETNRITEERLDESVLRILQAKIDYGIIDQDWQQCDFISLAAHESINTAQTIARSAVTILKGDNLLPLKGRIAIVDLQANAATIAEDVTLNPTTLSYAARGEGLDYLSLPFDRDELDLERLQTINADIYVVTTMDAHRYQNQLALIKALKQKGQVFAVGLRTPYEYKVLSDLVDGYITTYSYRQPSLVAAWEVLTGKLKAPGILPVSIQF